jgi:hypothetical protein
MGRACSRSALLRYPVGEILAEQMSTPPTRAIRIGGGRILRASPVFDTYWRFAEARQRIFHQRVGGAAPPWTDDPVLRCHRFTNAYRASDRVSQFLIREVLYSGDQDPKELFFRCVLFKIFNRIDTWEELRARVGGRICWREYGFERFASALDELLSSQSIYSAAYIMPSPAFGYPRKHRNHLRLIEEMIKTDAPLRITEARSLQSVYDILLSYPSMGPFLAFQFAIDLNYSAICAFSEMEFVVAGPGAKDGVRKCFSDIAGLSEEDLIKVMAERADEEFSRLGLHFQDLWGRPLQLIDCQNLFCEVDKYARVVHPEHSGASGRTRIKQKFAPKERPCPQWYPPKWNVRVPGGQAPGSNAERAPRVHRPQLGLPLGEPAGR